MTIARIPTFPSDVHNRDTLDDHPFYRQMEIVAGVKTPLSWDVRDAILIEASAGNFSQVRYYNHQSFVAVLPYLRELFGSSRKADEKVLFEHLRRARARKLELPDHASWEVVLTAEQQNPRGILTMSELKRQRDERNGTTCPPLANNGQW